MMDINATLIGQMITFALFVFFTMKYVWPHLMTILEQRRESIAAGIAAAEKAERDLELAQVKAQEQLEEAKKQAAGIIEAAHRQANAVLEEAKSQARTEGDRLVQLSQQEIEQNYQQARQSLVREVSGFVIAGAEKILDEHLDREANNRMIDEFIGEV